LAVSTDFRASFTGDAKPCAISLLLETGDQGLVSNLRAISVATHLFGSYCHHD
jgi:hypothetical protein